MVERLSRPTISMCEHRLLDPDGRQIRDLRNLSQARLSILLDAKTGGCRYRK